MRLVPLSKLLITDVVSACSRQLWFYCLKQFLKAETYSMDHLCEEGKINDLRKSVSQLLLKGVTFSSLSCLSTVVGEMPDISALNRSLVSSIADSWRKCISALSHGSFKSTSSLYFCWHFFMVPEHLSFTNWSHATWTFGTTSGVLMAR